MKKIAYLLHRFPAITDTFIKREILCLKKAGTDVQVVSVWKPRDSETTPESMSEWAACTHFLLPRSLLSTARAVVSAAVRTPRVFVGTLVFALLTSRPGARGIIYQLFYFAEAILAAEVFQRNAICH